MLYQPQYSSTHQAPSPILSLSIRASIDLVAYCHRWFLLYRARIIARLVLAIGSFILRLGGFALIGVIRFINGVWRLFFKIFRRAISF